VPVKQPATEPRGMDFTLDDVQLDVQRLARGILEHATPERVRGVEASDDGIDRELWAELARADLLGIALPEDVGGSGLSVMELCVVAQEIGRRVAPVPYLSTIALAAVPIAALGSDDQRARLRGVITGDTFLTAALQEAARHDPLDPATVAAPDGDAWRIDGVKVAVPHAHLAEAIVVAARIDGATTGLFVVETSGPGLSTERTRSTHREPQATVTFAGAPAQRLGGDDAVRVLHRNALAAMCATGVGVLEEATRITAEYITGRQQFGKPIATFQGATLLAADAYIDTGLVRATTWSAIWRLSAGRSCDDELAIAKYWLADGGQRVVHACQHLHGGIGVDVEYPIHRYFLWAKELELALGGAKPQLLRIGASLAEDA
jgi:3-oxocholest-4-en-26-oyl-CoA dehydrogenase beta subunit